MSECPHCGKEVEIPARALTNVETYGNVLSSITECCGKIVQIGRVVSFRITPSDKTEDDWGYKAKK